MLDVLSQSVDYPTSDGRPLGETDVHRDQIIDLIHALQVYYADNENAYVSGNILMFYEEGDRNKHRSPDVLVALGVARKVRENYKIWEEGKAPDFIIEVTSKTTRSEDLGEKKGLYALLGVREYLIFDPLREYLTPNLKAWRLEGDEYVPVVGPAFDSEVLGLRFLIVESQLRVKDPQSDRLLPTRLEEAQVRREAELARHEAELARREAELARHEAELAVARSEAALHEERMVRERLQVENEALRRRLGESEGRSV